MYGGVFFDALRLNMKRHYDYVLIDSRTGLSDIADICTLHLPDVLVDCFTLSTQGIEGAARIAKLIQARPDRDRAIRILPVPMRIDQAEHEKAGRGPGIGGRPVPRTTGGDDGHGAARLLGCGRGAVPGVLRLRGDPGRLRRYPRIRRPRCSSSFERITGQITQGEVTRLPDMEASVRAAESAALRPPAATPSPDDVYLDFSPEDQLWAEWITAVLAGAGIRVRWADETSKPETSAETQPRVVVVVSQARGLRSLRAAPADRPVLAVSVSEARVPHELDDVPVLFLAGLTEDEAAATCSTGSTGSG